jgi:hypothetical protein
MSIDCEGYDLIVLMSNDFYRFRPRILIVEDLAPTGSSSIDEFCHAAGYRLLAMTGPSKIFISS